MPYISENILSVHYDEEGMSVQCKVFSEKKLSFLIFFHHTAWDFISILLLLHNISSNVTKILALREPDVSYLDFTILCFQM